MFLTRFAENGFNLQLCASSLGALRASILITHHANAGGRCTPSKLWLIILRQMNHQQSPILTNIQIKPTSSAIAFKYNQIFYIQKCNDLHRKARAKMRQAQGPKMPHSTMIDPLPAGPQVQPVQTFSTCINYLF